MPQDKPPFAITEEWPTPIVRDFGVFLDAVAQPGAYLSKSRRTLDRATLYALNAQMQAFQSEAHPRMDQEYYALLNLFQRICTSARLHVLCFERGKVHMRPTEAAERFKALNPAERYLALLEAMWVDCDGEDLPGGRIDSLEMAFYDLPALLADAPAGEEIRARASARSSRGRRLAAAFYGPVGIRLLSFFGFLTYTVAEHCKRAAFYKGAFDVAAFTITPLGKEFLRVLATERPYEGWNRPFRRGSGETAFGRPDTLLEEDSGADSEPAAPPRPPFYEAFLPLLPEGAVAQGMPRVEPVLKDQTLVFRVNLLSGRGDLEACSRTIAMSSKDTLADLHLAIQEAVGFDNDHLYAFYMGGKLSMRHAYNDDRGGDPPYACDATLGLLDLYLNQRILYLFDFGDCWQFEVVLTEVRDRPHKGGPRIIERRGKAPKQYPDWG